MVEFGAANAIMGDDNYGTDLPQTVTTDINLDAEKRMAKFSKTKEYKVLKDFMLQRIDFYQQFLPDGRPLTEVPAEERGNNWVVANAVIGEFRAMMAAYEQAGEVVKQAS